MAKKENEADPNGEAPTVLEPSTDSFTALIFPWAVHLNHDPSCTSKDGFNLCIYN
jgi:hypothetical protein